MAIDLHEYKTLYLKTSQDLVELLQKSLGVLSTTSLDAEATSEAHRAAHSLKSQSMVMGYMQIGLSSRALEILLAKIKQKELVPTSELLDEMHKTVVAISRSLAEIKSHKPEVTMSESIETLERISHMPLRA